MLKMVDGTGIIGVDMICPLGVSTPQPPNYDRVELEGTGMLVLPNSLDAPLEGLELRGKTEQVQTSGKNLANPSEFVIGTLAGDSGNIINLKQYITTGHIPVIPGKRYSTSCGNKFSSYTIIAYDNEKAKINSQLTMSSEMPEGAAYIRISYKKIDMTDVTESDLETFKKILMLNEGDTAKPHEPYTGGKPSPSPEYPQEIKNVGKWNEEKQKYEVDVRVTGKNLIGKYNILDSKGIDASGNVIDKPNACISDLIMVQKDQQHTLSLNNVDGITIVADLYDSNKKFIGYHFATASNAREFTLKDDCFIRFIFSKPKTYILSTNIQLETKKGASSYEPQREPQTLTLTSDRPLTKWDRLVEQGGQIGWLYAGVVIDRFDGQSNKISIANKQGNVQNFSILFENVANGNGNSDIFVDKYRSVQLSYTKAEYGICCNWNGGVKYFSAPNENVATVDEFKAWLVENPLKIAYETTKTEFVPLPQSEQNAIRALKTYYPTTVITADGGELDPDIKVTYRKEI